MPNYDDTVEVPGAADDAPPLDVAELAGASTVPEDPIKAARLDAEVAATAASIGNGGALDWSSLNQANAVVAGYNTADVDAHLPDQDSVDPDKLTEPVLTKQGWVIPTNDPRNRIGAR